jgi:sugar lactone lactonase YvrE
MGTLERVVDGLAFAESPRWHDGRLWFSDMHAERVMAVDPHGRAQTIVAVPGRPSGLGWLPDGRLLVVSMHRRCLQRLDPAGLVDVADLSPHCGGDANDMVVDERGRAYVGNVGFDLEDATELARAPATNLVRVDPDGSVRVVATDVHSPNGVAITGDGRTLVVGESAAARLCAWDVAEDGSLSNRRVFAALEGGAVPDGICLDAEGAAWVASPTTREFVRVLEGGRVTERISTGERLAIACALGDADRRTLFLVSAVTWGPEAIRLRASRIDRVEVDVPGAGWP